MELLKREISVALLFLVFFKLKQEFMTEIVFQLECELMFGG